MRGVRPWKSAVFRIVVSAAEGMLAVLAGGVLLAVLLLWLGLPSISVLRFAAAVLWTVGSALAGRRCGAHGRHRGALEGSLCGVLLAALWLCGAVLFHEMPRSLLLHGVLLPAAGAVGGVIGVNTRLRKAPD